MKREAGVDLFRVLGLLFVNALHACLYNGFYNLPQEGLSMWAADSFRWLFFGCNGMFMLMTGYLKTTKPFNKSYYRGLVPILVGYVLTCVVSYPIRHFVIGEKEALSVWIERFFTFSNYAWYVEMYIGLILISPFINMVFDKLEKPKSQLFFVGVLAFMTALPSITALNLIPDYWAALYPITYYSIGALIKRTKPEFSSLHCLFGAALTAMILGYFTFITAKNKFNDGFGQGYGGFWVTVMVTLLFLGIYRLKLSDSVSGLLAFVSGGVFEGYILSRLLDVWIYGTVKQWHNPSGFVPIFFCITLPVFVVSLTAGNILHFIAVSITKKRKL